MFVSVSVCSDRFSIRARIGVCDRAGVSVSVSVVNVSGSVRVTC